MRFRLTAAPCLCTAYLTCTVPGTTYSISMSCDFEYARMNVLQRDRIHVTKLFSSLLVSSWGENNASPPQNPDEAIDLYLLLRNEIRGQL